MNVDTLSAVVTLLVALSVASERLVEIIKGFVPGLNQENPDPIKEDRRKAWLQILAVGCGMVTAYLTKDTTAIKAIVPDSHLAWIPLGLLASGGSGFWNSVQTYLSKAKEVKSAQAADIKLENLAKAARLPELPAQPGSPSTPVSP